MIALGARSPVIAQTIELPPGFDVSLIMSGISNPTSMTIAPDNRIFVTQQQGRVRIVQNNELLATDFLTVSVNSAGERGLLGLAFDPNFATNQYVYVYYTTSTAPIHNRVSRFTANGNVALAGSEAIIFELDNLSGQYHNGGAIHFGPDGMLYVAVGENGVPANAQLKTNLHGKMLRIAPDGSIPSNNPFYTTTTGNNRAIWALGLRNPFSFAFQPGTGRLFLNDVGENLWEEINQGFAGANYGWPETEGATNEPEFQTPVYAYSHALGCAIVGAAFYNPTTSQFPADYLGDYFYGDYCGSWIARYDSTTETSQEFASGLTDSLVDVAVLPDGSLYYLSRGDGGSIYSIRYSANFIPPSITQNPVSQTVAVGEAVTFTCGASGTALTYRWRRNNVDIPGATASTYRIPAAALTDNGAGFRCVISNSAGSATSGSAQLTVVNGRRPSASITLPVDNSLYRGGDVIAYQGTATDPDTGTLPASAFTWEVVLHHDQHMHPFVLPTSGSTQGTFTIPRTSHGSTHIWYRIHLKVTDSTGLTAQVYRDIRPQVTLVRVNSVPPGLQITVDGQPRTTPFTINEIVGTNWQIGAASPQLVTSRRWNFQFWSDSGAASHTVTIPATSVTYTATFFGCPEPLISLSAVVPQQQYFTSSQPRLTWNRVSGATAYEIQIDSDPTFSHPQYINNTIPGTALSATVGPLQACLYYWRIRARDAGGVWRNWSPSTSFLVDAA